ncbi:MAG: TetR/AcrR family transcriptional regulator [Candidatus Aminicenantes bacterium]|nr:TetR/AcrR family transcriptional regulator [Candidatus Aminicenantes bacterium]
MIKTYSRDERKKHRREDNRLFILEAAEKIFSQRGYALSTVDDIAAEAQFSKATLYRYFKSKRDIFFDVIFNTFDEVLLELEDLRNKDLCAGEKLKELIQLLLQVFSKKQGVARIFYTEKDAMKKILGMNPKDPLSHSTVHKRVPKAFMDKGKELSQATASTIQEGIDSGEFRDMDADEAGEILGALLRGFSFGEIFQERAFSIEESSTLLYDFFLNGIKNHIHIK